MAAHRWPILILAGTVALGVAGCSRSSNTGRDPWGDYLVAQEIWKNERAMLDDFERLHPGNPSTADREVLDMLRERFDKASAHVKACRQKLPEE